MCISYTYHIYIYIHIIYIYIYIYVYVHSLIVYQSLTQVNIPLPPLVHQDPRLMAQFGGDLGPQRSIGFDAPWPQEAIDWRYIPRA